MLGEREGVSLRGEGMKRAWIGGKEKEGKAPEGREALHRGKESETPVGTHAPGAGCASGEEQATSNPHASG